MLQDYKVTTEEAINILWDMYNSIEIIQPREINAIFMAVDAIKEKESRYKDINEVIDTLQTWIKTTDDEYDREEAGRVCGLRQALNEIMKIKVKEQPHGHWISFTDHCICSCCGEWIPYYDSCNYNYCPNCGAKMVEGSDSDESGN